MGDVVVYFVKGAVQLICPLQTWPDLELGLTVKRNNCEDRFPQHLLVCEGLIATSDQRKKPHRRNDEAPCRNPSKVMT
jgi:hypothetical protein